MEDEETLNSYVFLNEDNTKTVYLMDERVKYVDAKGDIHEKDLRLISSPAGFSTASNNIALTIPNDPTNGVVLSDGLYTLTLSPEQGKLCAPPKTDGESVTFADYFGSGISLRYTPTLSGVKEDIILDTYSGINSFTFLLYTDGLCLLQNTGHYYLSQPQLTEGRVQLADIVCYDAIGQTSPGVMTVETVKEGQCYRLTITADEAFLTDFNTVYPVLIDPIMSFFSSEDTVYDAPIFQGQPSNNYGSYLYNRIGYAGSEYRICRTVMKLPGLYNNSTYAALSADAITSVTLYLTAVDDSLSKTFHVYPLTSNSTWTESTVTWNNVGSWAGSSEITGYLTGDDLSGIPLTSLVKGWKNGIYTPTAASF